MLYCVSAPLLCRLLDLLHAPQIAAIFAISDCDAHRTPQKSQRFPRQEKAMLHCDLRVRWKVASDLRFPAAISEPKTSSFFIECFRGLHRGGRNSTSLLRLSGPFFRAAKWAFFYLKTCTPVKGTPWSTSWFLRDFWRFGSVNAEIPWKP